MAVPGLMHVVIAVAAAVVLVVLLIDYIKGGGRGVPLPPPAPGAPPPDVLYRNYLMDPQAGHIDSGLLPHMSVTPTGSEVSGPRFRRWALDEGLATFRATLPSGASMGERAVAAALEEAVPGARVLYNYRDRRIVNPVTGRAIEYDAFLPAFRVLVEYNGKQHYEDSGRFGPKEGQAARDGIKRAAAYDCGLALVTVPHTVTDPAEIRTRILEAVRAVRGH
jgi:hypothetical protein